MKKKDLAMDKLVDQTNEYESIGEVRLSTRVKQISSRYQSMQKTIKVLLNKIIFDYLIQKCFILYFIILGYFE